MFFTQNTGASKETDRKFKMYKQMAKQSIELFAQINAKYEADCAEMKQRLAKNEKQQQNGGYAEYSNMITSIFNSEHLNNDHQSK